MNKLLLLTTEKIKNNFDLSYAKRFAIHFYLQEWHRSIRRDENKDEFKGAYYIDISEKKMKKVWRKLPKQMRELKDMGVFIRSFYIPDNSYNTKFNSSNPKPYGWKIADLYSSGLTTTTIRDSEMHGHTWNSLSSYLSGSSFNFDDSLPYLNKMKEVLTSIELEPEVWDAVESEDPIDQLLNIENEKFFFNIPNDSRLYTSATTLKSKFRNFICVNGESDWVKLDLDNSDWVHLACLFVFAIPIQPNNSNSNPHNSSTQYNEVRKTNNSNSNAQSSSTQYNEVRKTNNFNSNPHNSSTQYNEVRKRDIVIKEFCRELLRAGQSNLVKKRHRGRINNFIQDTIDGQIYSRLSGILGWRRSKTKKLMNVWLNASSDEVNDQVKEVEEALRDRYGIARAINILKQRCDKRIIGNVLRRLESDMIVHRIGKELVNSGVPCLTIHDCLMVPEAKQDLTRTLIKDKYKEEFAFAPSISKE